MAAYRIYFLGADGGIGGREDFEAEDDVSAIRIARALGDACSDICPGFELWQGEHRIRARQPPHKRVSLADLNDAHQRVVIETLKSILRSRWRIAQSHRLIGLLGSAAVSRPREIQSS